jgi:hypothetical protein
MLYLYSDIVNAALIAEASTNRMPFLLIHLFKKTLINAMVVIHIPTNGRVQR